MKMPKTLALLCVCGAVLSANAQVSSDVPTKSENTAQSGVVAPSVRPIVARTTPQQIVDYLAPSASAFETGLSYGMILGVAKTVEILSFYGLTPLKVCFPYGLSNGTLESAIIDKMRFVTIPKFGGNEDNWDRDAVTHIAIAAMEAFPCR